MYKSIRTEEVPAYLKGRKKEAKDNYIIARYRCGNVMKENQHWREEEDKICKVCDKELENMIHVLKKCENTKDKMLIQKYLNEEEKSWEIMKKIEAVREERKKREEESD